MKGTAMSTTVTGNLTAEPELRFTTSGTAVCNFTIASTPRRYDKDSAGWIDGETLFLRCTSWGVLAEHMADTFTKGSRVLAAGSLEQHTFTDKDGQERISIELNVEEIGASLRFAAWNCVGA